MTYDIPRSEIEIIMKRAETQSRILRPSLSITHAAATVEITCGGETFIIGIKYCFNFQNLDNGYDDVGVDGLEAGPRVIEDVHGVEHDGVHSAELLAHHQAQGDEEGGQVT